MAEINKINVGGTDYDVRDTSKLPKVTYEWNKEFAAAPNEHTHSYGSTTALTTSANSGSAVAAITGLTVNTTASSGDITYVESATHTHTGASVKTTEDVLKWDK